MPRPNTIKRNKRLLAEYEKLDQVRTKKGKRKLSQDAILEELSDMFCLSEDRIKVILYSSNSVTN